jgi:hypothetical protein
MPADDAPPDTSAVDPHRVEDLVNRFIAGKQDALFTAPDAYYRSTGADAVDGAPGILDRLNGLKQATLDAANDDGTRAMLDPRLDAHLDDARDGIDRHVAAQRDALTRQIISERQRLIQRAATLEHNNDGKLAGLAEAHATAAQELAGMNGEPQAPAMDAARSAIWRTAIDQRLTNGDGPQAIDLFDRMKDRLAPGDRLSLDEPLQVVRNDQAANQWIASQTGTAGPPLQDRASADPNLSPDAQLLVRAKLDARDSAQESSRAATVKALDDQIADVTRTLATTPGAYKTGTLSRIALAYDDAGEPDKAAATRRVATQEAVLVPFAQMSVDKQQRLIADLPKGELRDIAIAIQRQQADAFAQDPFAAGTSLYDEVGPPVAINDIQGRLRQARQIAELRGGAPVAPYTADESAAKRRGSSKMADSGIVLAADDPEKDPVYQLKRELHEETPGDDVRHGHGVPMLPPPMMGVPGLRIPSAPAKPGSNSAVKPPTSSPIPARVPESGGQEPNPVRPSDAAAIAKSEREKVEASWGKLNTLKRHFDDHGADFGATDQIDYARRAHEFLQRAQRENLPRKIDDQGVSRIYDPATNTFGAYNPDGTTRTFYTPDPAVHGLPTNMDYWNSQPGH